MPVQRTDAERAPLSGGDPSARHAAEGDETDRDGGDPGEHGHDRIGEVGPRHHPVRERGGEGHVGEAMEGLPLPERQR